MCPCFALSWGRGSVLGITLARYRKLCLTAALTLGLCELHVTFDLLNQAQHAYDDLRR